MNFQFSSKCELPFKATVSYGARMIKLLASDIFFDLTFYSQEAAQSFNSRDEAIDHFLAIGEQQGLNPSPFFMWSWVRGQIDQKSLLNYLGEATNIPPHPILTWVKVQSLISRPNWPADFSQWVSSSALNDIVPPIFLEETHDNTNYLFFNDVTRSNSTTPLETKYFSSLWYNMVYKDVSESGINPFIHYIMGGWKEGRDPSPHFSTSHYIGENIDVHDGKLNPLLHYANFGREQGYRAYVTKNYELAVRHQTLSNITPSAYVPFSPPEGLSLNDLHLANKVRLVIVVPFYKREDLVATLFGSLLANAEELRKISVLTVYVNDSPDYAPLDEAICRWFPHIESQGLDTFYICNPKNMGFVYSSNIGIWFADQLNAHCLLLNSDTIVTPGAITEMLAVVQSDEKFGFVNPRTNNATIATYGAKPTAPEEGYADFKKTHALLPRHRIVPVAVGFCLLIRAEIIKLFGYLDAVYGAGYNEENDFIMRANRRGFSSVQANHAFVAHLGKASFSVFCDRPNELNSENELIFLTRYPEFTPAIMRYFESSKFNAQRLIEQRNDVDVMIDLRCAFKIQNGTTRLIREILPFIFAELNDLKLGITASRDIIDFLGIDIPEKTTLIDDSSIAMKSSFNFLFAQPFSFDLVNSMLLSTERVGFFMLDTIAVDCLYIQEDGLRELWEFVCASGDLFIFNSAYTKDRFLKRFDFAPDALLVSSEHSLNPAEYAAIKQRSAPSTKNETPHLLIFGNHYEHKGLVPALNALSGKGFDLTVFGVELARTDVASYTAGQVSDQILEQIWSKCDVLVFPSFYEGFGFPIMEATARRKAIVLMDSELNRDLHKRLGRPNSFFFFQRFSDLEAIAKNALQFNGTWPDFDKANNDGWRRSAHEIAEAIRKSLARPIHYAKIEQRLFAMRSIPRQ